MPSDRPAPPKTMPPSELARLAGVSTDTLRYYERKGVLTRPARSRNGYRRYPADALDRVLLVRRGLRMGFSLDELSRVLAMRARGGAPCRQVRKICAGRLHELEGSIRELLELRRQLRAMLADWDRRLVATPPGEPAYLLASASIAPKKAALAERRRTGAGR